MIGVRVQGNPSRGLQQRRDGMVAETQRSLLRAAEEVAGVIDETVRGLIRPGRANSAGPTGTLARSFRAMNVADSAGVMRAGAFSTLSYAGIQDQGGVVKPKVMRHLAVPLIRLPQGTWPRNYGKRLTLIKSRKGNLILAEITRGRRRGQQNIKPVFVLKKSVTIPGKKYIRAAKPRAQQVVSGIIRGAVVRGIRSRR